MSRNVWFTSDQRFGDVRAWRERRGLFGFESMEAMDAALVAAWNRRVNPGDLVIHVGNLTSVPGRVRLVDELVGDLLVVPSQSDVPVHRGREMNPGSVVTVGGYRFVTGDGGPSALAGDVRLLPGVGSRWRLAGDVVNVGADAWGLAPVHVDDVIDLIAMFRSAAA